MPFSVSSYTNPRDYFALRFEPILGGQIDPALGKETGLPAGGNSGLSGG
jgi:hypothetical protein